MKRNFKLTDVLFRWIAPLCVLGCAILFVYAMGAREKPQRRKPPPRKSIPVEVVQARHHDGPISIVASGVAIPHREVALSTRVGGEVVLKSDSLSPGNYVRKGDLLLQIDDTDYKMEVARLEQELAKSNVDLETMKIEEENTQRMIAVNREIVELRKQGVSRLGRLRVANATSATESDLAKMDMLTSVEKLTMYDNQIRQYDSKTKSLEMARELIALQLQRAKIDLARTKIMAPFSGVVIENMVEQNANVDPGTMLAKIEDTSIVEVRCNLRTDDVAFIQKSQSHSSGTSAPPNQSAQSEGMRKPLSQSNPTGSNPADIANAYQLPPVPVTIEYEREGQTHIWNGVLSRQDGLGIDAKTRTMPVRIRVAQPTKDVSSADQPLALVRGMFVRVKIHCNPERPMLAIPEAVVRPGKKIWVTRDNTLQIQTVRITRIENGEAFINPTSTTLTVNDQIISSPIPNAKSGMVISLAKDGKPAGKQKASSSSTSAVSMRGDKQSMGHAAGHSRDQSQAGRQ